jgi:hypothetical protein
LAPVLTVSAGEPAPKDGSPTPPRPGIVSHIKVLSDKVPDVSNLDAWKKSYIKDGMTDQEKAMAIWKTVHTFQHQDAPPSEFLHNEGIVQDAIKIFNVYGYSFCGVATADTQALARHVGVKARGWTITNHVVPEVWWDNAWHLMDASLICYFPKADGKVASVEEISAGVKEFYAKHPELKGNDAKLRDYQFKGPGFKTGPDVLVRSPNYDQRGWLPALTHGWYATMQEYDGTNLMAWEPGYTTGYQVNIQLRKGERLTRNWSHKNLHANMDAGGGPGCMTMEIGKGSMAYCVANGDLAPGRVGNGTLEYNVPLASGDFRGGALSVTNLVWQAEDKQAPAVHVKDAAQPGEFIIRMPSSYLYLGGSLKYKAVVSGGGEVALAFSDNNGLDWKEISKATSTGEQTVDLKPLTLRRYDYRIKVTMKGKGTGLDALTISNDIQHSQRPLPALDNGTNTISFSSEAQEGTITIEAATVPDHKIKHKQLFYSDFHPTVNNIVDPELQIKGATGDITFPISTPGEMTRLRFGTYYRARDAKGGWDYQVSFDEGKTFKTVDRASGPTARDVKFVTVNDVPPGTKSALVRFSGNTNHNATLIMAFRIDADYKEPHGGFAPVKVTYNWEENGQPKQNVFVAKSPSDKYTIKCDAKPLMKSIVLELAE